MVDFFCICEIMYICIYMHFVCFMAGLLCVCVVADSEKVLAIILSSIIFSFFIHFSEINTGLILYI